MRRVRSSFYNTKTKNWSLPFNKYVHTRTSHIHYFVLVIYKRALGEREQGNTHTRIYVYL